jgi:hypothetical protein
MKKTALTIFILLGLVCALMACNTGNSIETDGVDNSSAVTTEAFEQSEEQSEEQAEVTVDGIMQLFDEKYYAQEYTADMIAKVLPNLESNGIILNGEVTAIVHIVDKITDPASDEWTWAYVYEFTEETDAVAFETNRRAFVGETGACVRLGNIVVFGTAPVIFSIAQ